MGNWAKPGFEELNGALPKQTDRLKGLVALPDVFGGQLTPQPLKLLRRRHVCRGRVGDCRIRIGAEECSGDDEGGHDENAGQPTISASRIAAGQAEEAADAGEHAETRAWRQARQPRPRDARGGFSQGCKRRHVGGPVAADADGDIVTAVLALGPDAARDPPDGGVIEQNRLDEALQQVDQVVVSAEVGDLVGEDGLNVRRGQSRQHAHRHQHRGTQDTHRHGSGEPGRFEQADRSGQAQLPGDPSGGGRELGLGACLPKRQGRSLQTHQAHPAANVPDGQQRHARNPHNHHPRQRRTDEARCSGCPADRWGRHLVICIRRSGWQDGLGRRRSGRCVRHGVRGRSPRRPEVRYRRRVFTRGHRHIGGLLSYQAGGYDVKRNHRCGDHGEQGHTRHAVSQVRRSPPKRRHRHAQQGGDNKPLPEEVHQRPAEPLRPWLAEYLFDPRHCLSPCSFSTFLISRTSSADTPPAERACRINLRVEPPNTCPASSRTSRRRMLFSSTAERYTCERRLSSRWSRPRSAITCMVFNVVV